MTGRMKKIFSSRPADKYIIHSCEQLIYEITDHCECHSNICYFSRSGNRQVRGRGHGTMHTHCNQGTDYNWASVSSISKLTRSGSNEQVKRNALQMI